MAPLGKNTRAFLVKDDSDWAKIWTKFTGGRPPKINFKASAVAIIVAGREDRADRIEVDSLVQEPDAFIVRFKLVVQDRLVQVLGAKRAAAREAVPFLMRVVPRTSASVQFEAVE